MNKRLQIVSGAFPSGDLKCMHERFLDWLYLLGEHNLFLANSLAIVGKSIVVSVFTMEIYAVNVAFEILPTTHNKQCKVCNQI